MKWLLIGGAGFVGSNLTRMLRKENHLVTVYDIVDTPKVCDVSYTYVRGERIPDYNQLYQLMANADIIVHLASIVGVDNVMNDPHTMFFENIELARMIHKANSIIKNPLFYASSSEVYGCAEDYETGVLRESDITRIGHVNNKRFMYACAKRSIESIFQHGEYPSVIGRFFNITGPYQDSNKGVIAKMVRDATYDRKITIEYGGEQTRTFTHVNTACKAIISLMTSGGSAFNEVFNIGSNNTYSINKVAACIIMFLKGNRGFDVDIKHIDKDLNDPFVSRVPCTEKLSEYVDVCEYGLPKIVADVLDYREQRDDKRLMETT